MRTTAGGDPMSWKRAATRAAWRTARAGISDVTRRDAAALGRRMKADRYWRDTLDGAAPRLGPRSSIEVSRVGRFRRIDPHHTAEGWRDPWKAVGLGMWVAAVGAAWWVGSSRGRGPLGILADEHERPW